MEKSWLKLTRVKKLGHGEQFITKVLIILQHIQI